MAKKVMRQVTQTYFAQDGVTPLYGAGELHEQGADLPQGVLTRDVVVDDDNDAAAAAAPVHALDPERATHQAERAREVERIQTERSQPATDEAAAGEVSEEQLGYPPGAGASALAATNEPSLAAAQEQGTATQGQATGAASPNQDQAGESPAQTPAQSGGQAGAGQTAGGSKSGGTGSGGSSKSGTSGSTGGKSGGKSG